MAIWISFDTYVTAVNTFRNEVMWDTKQQSASELIDIKHNSGVVMIGAHIQRNCLTTGMCAMKNAFSLKQQWNQKKKKGIF